MRWSGVNSISTQRIFEAEKKTISTQEHPEAETKSLSNPPQTEITSIVFNFVLALVYKLNFIGKNSDGNHLGP